MRGAARIGALVSNPNSIRVAVIGAGAFGRNHARVYRELERAGAGVQLVAIVDLDVARAQALLAELGADASAVRVFASTRELLDSDVRVDAASVAVPTSAHLAVA